MNSRSVLPYYQSLGSSLKYAPVICDRRDGQKDVSNDTFAAALSGVIHGGYRPGSFRRSVLPTSRTDTTGPHQYRWLVSTRLKRGGHILHAQKCATSPDAAPISSASGVALSRYPAKRHYLSDILVGSTLGYVTGTFLAEH